jgi:2-dehydro-3-deoxy-L-rhamnonate dehydrogenase (NAD+)
MSPLKRARQGQHFKPHNRNDAISAMNEGNVATFLRAGTNTYRLSGQRAVVTGGAQGIGRAITERLVASGAQVEIWDVDSTLADEAASALGSSVRGRAVDVTDATAVEAAAGAHERVDILVCSAGIAGPNAKTWEYPLEAWAKVMRINVDGVFHCCRAVVPLMLRNRYGRIINIASVAGKEGNPNASAYSASKAAVIGLTKSLGKELADRDIAVNCITPAAARTRIFDQMSEEHIAFMLSKIPRGRFLEVEEVASLVAWLASPENSFTTAAVFDISGGRATY